MIFNSYLLFILIPLLDKFINMFIQYIIYKNKNMNAEYYQNKVNNFISLFKNKISDEKKLKEIIEN